MAKPARLFDSLSFLFTAAIVLGTAYWTWQSGFLNTSLLEDQSLSWHLVRSSGITAYILMTISMIWGLALSSRIVKDWSPGTLSMLLHASISWLAVCLYDYPCHSPAV